MAVRKRKSLATKVGGRNTFTRKTKSRKGSVKGYVSGKRGTNSAKSTVVKRTNYKTRSGASRVLEIITTRRVIKK